MRKYRTPILIGLASFLFGVGCLYAFLKGSPDTAESMLGAQSKHSKPIVSALNLGPPKDEDAAPAPQNPSGGQAQAQAEEQEEDDFMAQDPFMAARKLHEQMEKEMRGGFAGFDVSEENEIVAREDDKSVSYEIKDVEGGSLNTSVKDGYLTISGESKKVNGSISFQSSFHRSFPLPPNVDPSKMETISEKDRVVLRFPKRHS